MNISLSFIPSPVPSTTLTLEQSAAIQWISTSPGNLILDAVAGSGKTFTLIEQIIAINLAYPSATIALMAFNSKVAAELRAKASLRKLRNTTVGTVHSFGYTACKTVLGSHIRPDGDKLKKLLKPLLTPHRLTWKASSPICRLVSLGKDTLRTDWLELKEQFDHTMPEEVTPEKLVQVCDQLLEASNDYIRTRSPEPIDFSDQLYLPLKNGWEFQKYDFVFVDEAQDTNLARRRVVEESLKPESARLIAVGDPHQAIYGFTGADNDALQQIKEKFQCSTLPLSFSFRCDKAIIREAQKFVPHIKARDTAGEGVVRKIKEVEFKNSLSNIPPTAAILCRINAPLVRLCFDLLAKGIACRIEGRDIGFSLVALIDQHKDSPKGLMPSLWNMVSNSKLTEDKLADLQDKVEAIDALAYYYRVKGFKIYPTLRDFITNLFTDSEPGKPQTCITLSSIHKSKGLEWDTVYFFGRNLWNPWPYATKPWQLQQEDNLTYVAITRARHELVMVDVEERK